MELTKGDRLVLEFLKPRRVGEAVWAPPEYLYGFADVADAHPVPELVEAGLLALVGPGGWVCLTQAGLDEVNSWKVA
jgi:hypothetical protein